MPPAAKAAAPAVLMNVRRPTPDDVSEGAFGSDAFIGFVLLDGSTTRTLGAFR
jgi:hypothetical protein